MGIETILVEVNAILLECPGKKSQEEYIKRKLSTEKREILENTMKQYSKDYECDFKKLQKKVHNDLSADNFEIVN